MWLVAFLLILVNHVIGDIVYHACKYDPILVDVAIVIAYLMYLFL